MYLLRQLCQWVTSLCHRYLDEALGRAFGGAFTGGLQTRALFNVAAARQPISQYLPT